MLHVWVGLFTSVFMVVLTVLIHYEGLQLISRAVLPTATAAPRAMWARLLQPQRGRLALVAVMFTVFALHVAQIWLYGLCFWLLESAGFGALQLAPGANLGHPVMHYIYFAAVCYTSLGFGELLPTGALRLVSGTAALNGLLLIAWSASFTFLMMERLWGKGR